MRKQTAVFANFICKFGEKNLVDYLEEIVLPAFTNDTQIRRYGNDTEYYFHDVKLLNVGSGSDPQFAVAGRFVKEYKLRREQVFDARSQELKTDERTLDTAPSSFFLLLLAEHRLVYLAETAAAPDIKAFAATASYFLRDRWRTFTDQEYNKANEVVRTSRKSIVEQHPMPVVAVVPIAGSERVDAFIKRYSVLSRIEITVHERNDEIDGAELMEGINSLNRRLDGSQTRVVTYGGESGLDRNETAKAVAEMGKGGNQTVKLIGTDEQGNKLVGDNDEFSVTAELSELPPTTGGKAHLLFEKFKELANNGVVVAGHATAAVRKRIAQVMATLL